jgi:DNA-binding transcriptional LysR family regulator
MLEKSLGVPLFDRLAEGVSLTVYGETMLRRAENVLVETSELEREIQLLKGLGAGRFSVAMGIYSAEVCGNRAMAELLRDHPQLRCHIAVTDWPTVANLILSRRADIGFAEVSEARKDERLQIESTGQHEVVFFCRRGTPCSVSAACRNPISEPFLWRRSVCRPASRTCFQESPLSMRKPGPWFPHWNWTTWIRCGPLWRQVTLSAWLRRCK